MQAHDNHNRESTTKWCLTCVSFAYSGPCCGCYASFIVAYALSPIDLIPDFIPVIGLLDDIIIIPLGLALIIKLTPPEIMASAHLQAMQAESRPTSYSAAVVFIIIWLGIIFLFGRWFNDAIISI